MDKRYRHLLRATLAALPLACAAVLSSCAFDDDVAECPDPNAPATVRVSVSAGEPGDLNGTRAGDDVNADEQEFMHTLYLCILDEQGYVQEMFHAEDGSLQNLIVSEPAAATGDIFNWTSDEFTLPVGTYTIYAFANVDGYIGENDQTEDVDVMRYLQNQFRIGAGVRTDLPRFRLNDPASKIDFAIGMYIPMSAKKTITITPNTRDISIGLDRLVSKVRITVPDNQYVSTNSTITFSGYSENVPLLGADNGGYGDAQLYGGTTTTDEIRFTQVGEDVSFYVNETPGGNPFTVTLSTGNTTGGVSTYTATTDRDDLPRNSIFPLTLTFTGGNLDLVPAAYLQVTGVPAYNVKYDVDYTTGTYTFGIAYGSYLTIIPSIQNAQGTPQFTWNVYTKNPVGMAIPDKEEAVSVGLPTLADGGFLCSISAGEGYYDKSYAVTLNAVWTGTDGNNYNRTYNVIVKTSQDYDTVLDGIIGNPNLLSGRTRSVVTKVNPERLYMVKTK